MKVRRWWAAMVCALACWIAPAYAQNSVSTVVEFYNQGLDHYFITTSPQEIFDLDTGVHPGWQRTGYFFGAVPAGAVLPVSNAVCRFYGNPQVGLNSHFYTANPQECFDVLVKFPGRWLLESNEVFRAQPLTIAGTCPAATDAVYRLWNHRSDSNHRYTTSVTIYDEMVAQGWIPEGSGSGPRPVVFCMPQLGNTSMQPVCSVAASNLQPQISSGIVLSASCSGNPTSYQWTNTGSYCSPQQASCLLGATAAGAVTYSVAGSNAYGTGTPASVTVNWQPAVPVNPLPHCTIMPEPAAPLTGDVLTLSLSCDIPVTTKAWMTCSSATNTCTPLASCGTAATCTDTQVVAGTVHYAADVKSELNQVARATVDVAWIKGPMAPTCTVTPSDPNPVAGSTLTLASSCTEAPTSYTWTGCTPSPDGTACTATAAAPGPASYRLVASNAKGSSAPVDTTVQWTTYVPPTAPVCTLVPGMSNPTIGIVITLTASCSGNPTAYAWTNCSSSADTCYVTSGQPVPTTYSVVATNSIGPSNPASATVNWQALPGTPTCTISTQNNHLWAGQQALLVATCSNSPTSFFWSGCEAGYASGNSCVLGSEVAGQATVSVTGSNSVGQGTPGSITVYWADTTNAGMCLSYPANVVRNVQTAWGVTTSTVPADYGTTFPPDAILVAEIVVPATGTFSVPALIAQATNLATLPVTQQASLSTQKCDFRTADPTGVSGPFAMTFGHPTNVSANWGTNLLPGQTYYVNVRNYAPLVGLTCKDASCPVTVNYTWPTP